MSNELSVIIPAYRAAQTIGRAIDSVLAQTQPPTEILVVDDGSPDDLAGAVRRYGIRVTLLRQAQGGAASARNVGLERARGQLIAFLDADDYWEPDKIERQLAVLQRHPEVGLVAGQFFEEVPGQPRVLGTGLLKPGSYNRVLRAAGEDAFTLGTRIWTGTVLVRREILGEERFVPGLEPAEDRDLWVRLVTSCPVYLMAQPLATAVLHPGSLSRSSIDRDCGNMLRVIRRHGALLGKRGLRRWEADTYRRWAGNHLAQGRPREAAGLAWKRLQLEPWSPSAWWVFAKVILSAKS
jgi:glycosyltransferase involved in cell wall biosynthesis